jgi:hypothetical protein
MNPDDEEGQGCLIVMLVLFVVVTMLFGACWGF